ncbi:hypothetical protein GOODEAATRI_005199 [Goodea atripinnis]|uniref:Immunoglobulin domain-containing protein n=1 Tax=Goodea atripinnis TaxID=208336 RepID=A0ABV0N925_9TELE
MLRLSTINLLLLPWIPGHFPCSTAQIKMASRNNCSVPAGPFLKIKLSFSILHLHFLSVFLCKVTTEEEFTVLEGGSLTIPCHYEPQYVSYVKYWCQGRTKEFCTILARTDDHHLITTADQKVNIFDDPVQLVFTVTMNDMKEGESGWYMCGVEIGGMWNADDTSFTNIKVIHGE